ncbi:MAG: membrane protein insertion efficiency factor YidD [Rickettsiales bacterium]
MIRKISVLLIKVYQAVISPFMPKACRFYPTCSEYAVLAFSQKSLPQAFWLTLKRIMRCHPFCEGGHDPLPNTQNK